MFFKDFGCTLCRQLSDSHFQVRSFVKHLLWHQNYFGMDYPPPLPRILDGEGGGVQTMGANTYLYGCVSLLASKCAVCLCLCVGVFYQIRVLAKNQIICQTTVNLIPSGIKHTARSF